MPLLLAFLNGGGNINAVKRKEVLKHFILTETPTILSISESNLHKCETAPRLNFEKYNIYDLNQKRLVSYYRRDSDFTPVEPAIDLGLPIHIFQGRGILVASIYSEFKTYSEDGSFVKNERPERLRLLGNALKFLVGMAAGRPIIVGGDTNFDVKQQFNKEVREYLALLKVLGFEQKINEITRPRAGRLIEMGSETSAEAGTIIDHILTKKFTGVAYATVVGESDHYAVVFSTPDFVRISKRPWVEIKVVKYTKEIYRWAWDNYPFGRPDERWDNLEDIVWRLEEYMEAVQVLATSTYKAKAGVPWWTPQLTKLKLEANIKPKTFEKTKKYKKAIKEAQKKWDNHSMQIKGHPYRSKERTNLTRLKVGGVIIDDKKEIASELADFFEKKVDDILEQTNPDFDDLMKEYKDFNSRRGIQEWEMVPPTRKEVLELIDSLPNKSSSGVDDLPYTLCKFLRDRVAEPIYQIFQLVFKEGRVLDRHKLVKITGVYKKGCPENPKNFRPVGIGFLVMRLIEKWIAKQISLNCQRQPLLPAEIHGFVKNKSCETCLISVRDHALAEKAKGNNVCMVFLDATAAFDTIPRDLIVSGMDAIKCGPKSMKLIKNYLGGKWMMKVGVQGEFSRKFEAKAGVVQGGGCSATLYAVATSILEFLTKKIGKIFIYADDSALVISSPETDRSKFSDLVRDAIKRMLIILIKLGLKNNEEKSEILPLWDCSIDEKFLVNGFACKPSTTLRFLGCILNKHLTQSDHVKEIARKMQLAHFKIRTEKYNRSGKQVAQFIKSHIMSHIMYAINYWLPNTTLNEREELQAVMNKNVIPLLDSRSYKERSKKRPNHAKLYGGAKIENMELLFEKLEVKMAMKLAKVAEDLEYGREGYSKARMILPMVKGDADENRRRKIWNSFPLHAISFWSKNPKLKLKLYLKKLTSIVLDYEAKSGKLPRPGDKKSINSMSIPILWRLEVVGQLDSAVHAKLMGMHDLQYKGRRFRYNNEADYLVSFPDPTPKRERQAKSKGGLL